MLSHVARKISSQIYFHLRGGKSIRIPVECSFVFPEILVSHSFVDFGNIPIMGNNYQESITLTNFHKSEVKLELAKRADCEDYLVEVRIMPKIRT